MFAKAVHITQHALRRMLTRYREWQAYTDNEIRERLTKLALAGSPVGCQIQNNLAVEITLDTGELIYLVGHMTTQTFVVRTVLSKEQLVSNMRSLDIRAPTASPIKEQRRHKRHKKTERYQKDHQDPDAEQLRTKRDQHRHKLRKRRFDDDTQA